MSYKVIKNLRWKNVTYTKGSEVDKIPEGADKYKDHFEAKKKKATK